MMTPSTHRVRADAQVASRCMQTRIFPRIYQWLFFAIAIQLQPHGGKHRIVLYQEMWLQRRLHVSKLLSAATSHGSTGEVPVLEHETFSRSLLNFLKDCPRNTSYMHEVFLGQSLRKFRTHHAPHPPPPSPPSPPPSVHRLSSLFNCS